MPSIPAADQMLRGVAWLPRGKEFWFDAPFRLIGVRHLGADHEWFAEILQFDDDAGAWAFDGEMVEQVIELRMVFGYEIPNQHAIFNGMGGALEFTVEAVGLTMVGPELDVLRTVEYYRLVDFLGECADR